MVQSDSIFEYLANEKIRFTDLGEGVFKINGETFEVMTCGDDPMFTEDFVFTYAGRFDTDYYAYYFGGRWYYTPRRAKSVKLTPLKYLNQVNMEFFNTEVFLGVHGGFEILNGSGLYDRWASKAKFLNTSYLGICEKNTLAGVFKFQDECKKCNINSIIGATYTVMVGNDYKYDVKLFVQNEEGWHNLLLVNKEVNVINQRFIYQQRLFQLLSGLIIVLDPKSLEFHMSSPYVGMNNVYYALDTAAFDDETYDTWYLENLKRFYKSKFKPLPLTDAYYLDPEDAFIKDTLNKVSGEFEYKSQNQYFKDKDVYFSELGELIKGDEDFALVASQLLDNELTVAQACGSFRIQTGARHLPKYVMTEEERKHNKTTEDLFWNLIADGLERLKYKGVNIDKYVQRVNEEVSVIEKGKVLDYFLMLHDIVSWCKKQGILVGIGRGSAGGSLVSMLLGLIHLDPIEFDLLFSRFINEGRIVKTLPDIDTDVEAGRRGEVKKYMEQRFGHSQVISVGTYTALQLKASLKDLGRAFGLHFEDINILNSFIDFDSTTMEDFFKTACKKRFVREFVKNNPELINAIPLVLGQPKAKSVHACAMVIFPSEKDMFSWAPIVKQEDLYVSEWEGDEMESAGFLKEDILGIKQLDKFRNIIELVKKRFGETINIYDIPYDDETVFRYFRKGYNGDVFHFGSPGLTKYCTELLPDNIEDLIAGISLYRPGAIENNFHNEYVLCKHGKRDVEYLVGTEEILGKTFGVFVFQEQIMKLCQVLGGLTMVEADDVRKAMVKKRYEELTKYRDRFIPYYIENFGVSEDYAVEVWDKIDKASEYLFNRSHAAAYAITGYICQWLKVHYPLEYWVTAFEFMSQEDVNDGKIPHYISEINKMGSIKIYPVDINASGYKVTTDDKAIYWSITSVKQVGGVASEQIVLEREKNGPYFSFEEFLSRHSFKNSKVNKSVIENLIYAGAFDGLEKLQYSSERAALINFYRKTVKLKIDAEKDLFMSAGDLVYEDWWWNLQQKRLSGIAFFDFEELCDKYLTEHTATYLEQYSFQDKNLSNVYYAVGGYIVEVNEREAKKKGKYCSILIESNSEFLWVNIFPDHYQKLLSVGYNFLNSVGNLLIVSGMMKPDDFKKVNVLKVWDNSQIALLEG